MREKKEIEKASSAFQGTVAILYFIDKTKLLLNETE